MIETNRIELKNIPRSNELMRVFRDVEMVEALGSGMNRIMRTYGRDNFEFGDNYIRMIVPYNWIPEDESVGSNDGGNIIQEDDVLIFSADGNVINLVTEEFNSNGTFTSGQNKAYSTVIVDVSGE